MGFNDRPDGHFIGDIMDPAPVYINAAGRLRVGQPGAAE